MGNDWQRGECYLRQEGDLVRIGNSQVERVLSLAGGQVRTVAMLNHITGRRWDVGTRAEARLTLAGAGPRIEIPWWRYRPGTREAVLPDADEGFRAGFQRPEYDDTAWRAADCFTAVGETPRGDTDPVWPGYGWFRARVDLPASAEGSPLFFCFGGLDNEDWQRYRLFVNGQEAATRAQTGRWREPAPFAIGPGHPAYGALRFGADNLIAVQTGGLDKRLPTMIPAEMEHYMARSRLVDQFISVGAPFVELCEWELQSWVAGGDRHWLWATFWARSAPADMQVVYHYQVRAGEPLIRKRVEVRNTGLAPRLLLDVDVEDLELPREVSDGGQGFPIFVDGQAYTALEHPAGVNQGWGQRIRLRHFPGATLAPRQGLQSQTALWGVTAEGRAAQGFRDYLRRNGRRKEQWISIYDPLGLVDGTNAHDPMHHLSEEVALDTVATLADLRRQGVTFDYYIIDYGWQDTASDLTWFRSDDFPRGPGLLRRAVAEQGMRFGLWFGVSYGAWTCGDYPPARQCVVPRPRGQYDLCVAAEPYRSILRDAALYHIRENGVRALKIDMARFYCNSTEHGHLPGKYSVEAQMDAMVQAARAWQRACPDLFVMWYWGFASPFWLLYGDTLFDKGLNMEAAAVASAPNPGFRASTSLNLDQAVRHAELVPLAQQDSLGIWLGDVDWCNHMGKEGWREAWLLDLARGSLLSQLWGDLASFDAADVAFLAEWQAFVRENGDLYRHTRPILGDPWRAEPYGYAAGADDHAVVTLHNPGFRAAQVELPLDGTIGLGPGAGELLVRVRHRRRGLVPGTQGERHAPGEKLRLSLGPFEVMVLEIGAALSAAGWPPLVVDSAPDSTPLPVVWGDVPAEQVTPALLAALPPNRAGYGCRAVMGRVCLPAGIGEDSALALVVRLSRGGAHWYHNTIAELIRLRAGIDGRELQATTVPARRTSNGPGSPWLLFRLPVQEVDAGQEVRLELAGALPEGVDWQIEAWLYPA